MKVGNGVTSSHEMIPHTNRDVSERVSKPGPDEIRQIVEMDTKCSDRQAAAKQGLFTQGPSRGVQNNAANSRVKAQEYEDPDDYSPFLD